MKLFIEIPTWLGDAVMATPAIENIMAYCPKESEITIFGSYASTKLFVNHPNVKKILIDDTKKDGNRFVNIFKLARSLDSYDMTFSFRNSFGSKFLSLCLNSKKKYIYKRAGKKQVHQAERYNEFINRSLGRELKTGELKLYFTPQKYQKPTLGINPGATYGSAKRWYPLEFAKVALELSDKYDIVIFGGPAETNIAGDIEKELKQAGIKNYKNLAGKTTVPELIEKIGGLDLFITNDSGPMHIAAVFKVKTAAIFGPTKHIETHQWNNPNEILIRKEMECAPCMKRVCPLKHHKCMKDIKAEEVLRKINE